MHPTLTGWLIIIVMILVLLKLLERLLISSIEISKLPWGWSSFFGITGGIAALIGWQLENSEMTFYSLGAALFLPICIGIQRLVSSYMRRAARAKKAQERAQYRQSYFQHS